MELQIIKKRKFWYIISSSLILLSIISLIVFGLKPAIDFTGGTLMEIKLSENVLKNVDTSTGNNFAKFLNEKIANTKTGNITVQKSSDNDFILRFKEISNSDREELMTKIKEEVDSGATEMKFEAVGPILGKELQQKDHNCYYNICYSNYNICCISI